MIKNANWNECHLNEQSAYSSCLSRSSRLHLFAGDRVPRFFSISVSGRKDSSPDAVKTGGQACMIK